MRMYGFYKEKYFDVKEFNKRYPILDVRFHSDRTITFSLYICKYNPFSSIFLKEYYDLTISTEVDRPIWSLSSRERVGQSFFQTPVIPFLYERGSPCYANTPDSWNKTKTVISTIHNIPPPLAPRPPHLLFSFSRHDTPRILVGKAIENPSRRQDFQALTKNSKK